MLRCTCSCSAISITLCPAFFQCLYAYPVRPRQLVAAFLICHYLYLSFVCSFPFLICDEKPQTLLQVCGSVCFASFAAFLTRRILLSCPADRYSLCIFHTATIRLSMVLLATVIYIYIGFICWRCGWCWFYVLYYIKFDIAPERVYPPQKFPVFLRHSGLSGTFRLSPLPDQQTNYL